MNYIQPVFIPINTHSEPDRCPKCKKLENIKQLCRECGYEYPEEESSGSGCAILMILLAFCFVIWAIITLITWTTADCTDSFHHNDIGDCTLVDVLKAQWEWLKDLFGRVW